MGGVSHAWASPGDDYDYGIVAATPMSTMRGGASARPMDPIDSQCRSNWGAHLARQPHRAVLPRRRRVLQRPRRVRPPVAPHSQPVCTGQERVETPANHSAWAGACGEGASLPGAVVGCDEEGAGVEVARQPQHAPGPEPAPGDV